MSLILGLPSIFGNETLWPMLFVFAIVPCAIQVATFLFCPESPKFTLVIKGNNGQAKKDLQIFRDRDDVSSELEEMEKEAAVAVNLPKVAFSDMIKSEYRWPLTIALVLVVARQLSGVNIINFYSTMLFVDAGLTKESAAWTSVAFGVVKVLTNFGSAFVVDCKGCGRRPLLLSGFAGCTLSLVLLTASLTFTIIWGGGIWVFVSIGAVLLFTLCWAWGPGPIPWFYITEVFSSSARGKATSLASTCNWTSTFIIGLVYLPLNDWIGQYTFLICATILAFAVVFILLAVPETKGKSPQEIQAAMRSIKKK